MCLATVFAFVITSIVYGFWPSIRIKLALLFFAGFWTAFYVAGLWIFLVRPAELEKKFPLSAQELRRRRDEFYRWLDSLGPR